MTVERLYTPWRMNYIATKGKKKPKDPSIFLEFLHADPIHDRENFLLYRGQHTFIILNIYPYNPGHLMIIPNEPAATLAAASPESLYEMMQLAAYFTELIQNVMQPDGFNLGMNIGKSAGAGIENHLHFHIVPRWNGDSNFMPIVGNTRVLPEELTDTFDKLLAAIQANPPKI